MLVVDRSAGIIDHSSGSDRWLTGGQVRSIVGGEGRNLVCQRRRRRGKGVAKGLGAQERFPPSMLFTILD